MSSGQRQEEMTTTERLYALLAGKPIDQVPLCLMARGFFARCVGYDRTIVFTDPTKHFWSQVWTGEMYGIANLGISFVYHSGYATAFGGEVTYPTSEFAQSVTVSRFPVNSEGDIDKLQPVDIKDVDYVKGMMEICRLAEKFGLPIVTHTGTPFCQAENLCGPALLLTWMIKKPQLVHRLLRLVTDYMLEVVKYWVQTFGVERLVIFHGASMESNQLISPRHFREFSFPYTKELNEKILALGVKYIFIHICGDQNLNLPYWAQIPMGNPGIVSIGHEVDLTTAIKYFGDSCIIAGNLEPAVIQQGTPQQVYELARQCIGKGKNAPRGYILMPGCELPPNAPPYNVYMLRKAINDFGWYG